MTYRVRLLKSWANKSSGKKYTVGTIIQCDNTLSAELIREKIGEHYDGDYPPKVKVKTDFFKPKKIK